MKKGIYIYQNNKQEGPYSEEHIRGMLEAGDVSNISLAWRDGMSDWQPLKTILSMNEPAQIQNTKPATSAEKDYNEQEIKEETQEEVKEQIEVHGPSGVGGWLLFFCVGLTILGPLFSFGQMEISWEQAKPAFDFYPSLRTAIYWENLGFSAIIIYGFIVGCIIWGGSPKGKEIAKKYLLIRLFGFIGVEIIAMLLLIDLPAESIDAAIASCFGAGIREFIVFLIWWFYFKKSKRVRNTYG